MPNSTLKLRNVLERGSKDEILALTEYNFSKGCGCKSIEEIIEQLRYNGSHDISYYLRDCQGIHYMEIVRDVADKMKIKPEPSDTEENIEHKILLKVWNEIWEKATEEEKEQLRGNFTKMGVDYSQDLETILKRGGLVATYIVSVIITIISQNLMRQALAKGAAAATGRSILAGPVAIVLSGILLAVDLMGPAYSKTIPSVLLIACMRQRQKCDDIMGDDDNG